MVPVLGGGAVCPRCSGPRWGGWGSLTLSPPEEKQARATQPQRHRDMLPSCRMMAKAGGQHRRVARLGRTHTP